MIILLSLALSPKTAADREKLGRGLQTVMAEDPTIRLMPNSDADEIVIGATGERHLEIVVDRLKREFEVAADVGRPQVVYKETLTRPADGERKVAAIIRGRPEYGHAKVCGRRRHPGSADARSAERGMTGGATRTCRRCPSRRCARGRRWGR